MRIILISILSIFISQIHAQSLGTISVNENYSATCEFDANVTDIFISNNELIETTTTSQGTHESIMRLYDYVIKGKTVIFSAYKQLQPKSVTILTDDGSTWYGIIKYDKEDERIYYPFKNTQKEKVQAKEEEESKEIIKTRLNHCLTSKTNFEPLGITKNSIYWEVSNIMTDEQYTYIKIVVENKSGHNYSISNGRALFEYQEGKSRNLKKKEASVKMDGLIVLQEAQEKINAYTTGVLGYVIESYPLNSDGKLLIRFIEADGKRNYEIKIPFKYLEKVKVFDE